MKLHSLQRDAGEQKSKFHSDLQGKARAEPVSQSVRQSGSQSMSESRRAGSTTDERAPASAAKYKHSRSARKLTAALRASLQALRSIEPPPPSNHRSDVA